MAGETQTLRMNIDASGARRGATEWVASLNKIATAAKSFEKLSAQMGKAGSSNGFAAMAKQLSALNGIKINGSLAKNVTALSGAMSQMRGPNAKNIQNIRSLFSALNSAKLNGNTGRSLATISSSLSGFRGPSKAAAANVRSLFQSLSAARINGGIASGLASVSNAMANFKGMGAGSARNFQVFVNAVNSLRVPPGIANLGSALSGLSSRFGSTSGAALRLGGSVNGIPWGRASAGAIQLTGNLRGLENAMSLSYQMGSQLRTVFGALTISGFTSAVVDATSTSDRLRYLLGAVAEETGEVGRMMEFASDTANKYGLDLMNVQRQFGRFAAAGRSTGLSEDQTQYVFESLGGQMRLFGLDAQQQERAILAITQMFQKGAVQAEEFKTQLGEQLPVFEAMRLAMVDITGDENVDIMKMMEQGMIGSDSILPMLEKMQELFGKGIPDALKNPLVGMQNLKNAWTEFLVLVGQGGVMDALGEVSWGIAEILRGDEFQAMAKDIAEGLGNAIRKAGAAAMYLLNNIEMVGKVVGSLLGLKAATTIFSIGSAMGSLAGQSVVAVAGVGNLVKSFGGLFRGASLLKAIPLAIAGITGAFGVAALAAGAALGLMWDNTVQVGEVTTTVGAMAQVAFQDFGNWASWAGGVAWDAALQAANAFKTFFSEMGDNTRQNSNEWANWAALITVFVTTIAKTIINMFNVAWKVVVEGATKSIISMVQLFEGFAIKVQSLTAKMNPFNGGEADRLWAAGDAKFRQSADTFAEALGGGIESVEKLFREADLTNPETLKWMLDMRNGMVGLEQSVQDYKQSLADRVKPVDTTKPETAAYTPPEMPGEGLDYLNKEYNANAGALDSVGKRAKDAEDATKDYQAEVASLTSALDAGTISQNQFNDALEFNKKKLEEVVNPYGAMIRSMQEEANILRLNSKEQRTAADFQQRRNQLMEAGVVLTDKQTAELQEYVSVLDKLNNPSPLQSWIKGMEDFGDAVETAGVAAMEGLSDSIADLIVDGKADWESLFKSITKDLIKLGLNELWKGMFGTQEAQKAVNAPDISAMPSLAETDSITGMATAVAQGINMAGGGMGGFGNLGNDIGTGAGSWDNFQTFAGGKADGIGAGAGSFANFGDAFRNAGPALGGGGAGASGAVDLAESMLGMHEVGNNSNVNAFLKKGGVDIDAAQTAWCAGFVNSSLEQMGVDGSGSLVANDFLNWGTGVNPADVMRGDVMVKNNGLGAGQTGGHVGFATGQTRMGENGQMQMQMLSGNASNQVQYDWYNQDQVQLRRAAAQPGVMGPSTPAYPMPGMPGSPPMGGMMQPGMSVPGQNMSMPGMGMPGMGMPGQQFDFKEIQSQLKTDLSSGITEASNTIPTAFGPRIDQTAQQAAPKLVAPMEQAQQQNAIMAQSTNMQIEQNRLNAAMQTNSQAASDLGQKTSQAIAGAGGGMGGMGGGGLGGFGQVFGMLGPLIGGFFANGGQVGKSGGSQRELTYSSLIGDPDAEPIVAHKGELITPAHEVDRMRRLGQDAALVDNAAVSHSNGVRKVAETSEGGDSAVGVRGGAPRPIVNFNITTKDADSFRQSQSQIHAKAGAAAYRDAVRNH